MLMRSPGSIHRMNTYLSSIHFIGTLPSGKWFSSLGGHTGGGISSNSLRVNRQIEPSMYRCHGDSILCTLCGIISSRSMFYFLVVEVIPRHVLVIPHTFPAYRDQVNLGSFCPLLSLSRNPFVHTIVSFLFSSSSLTHALMIAWPMLIQVCCSTGGSFSHGVGSCIRHTSRHH